MYKYIYIYSNNSDFIVLHVHAKTYIFCFVKNTLNTKTTSNKGFIQNVLYVNKKYGYKYNVYIYIQSMCSPPPEPQPHQFNLAKSSLSSHIRRNFEFTSEKSVFVSIAILILFGKSPIHTSELRLFGEGQIDRKKTWENTPSETLDHGCIHFRLN